MTELFIISPLNDFMIQALGDKFNSVHVNDLDDPMAWLDAHGADVEYVLTDGHHGVKSEFLARLPNLKVASANGVGYDAIDTKATNEAGVIVTHTPGVLSEDVATTALMLVIGCYREFRLNTEWAHSGKWEQQGNAPLSRSVDNRKVGIIGLGRIGQAIADKLAPFQPQISYHGRSKKDVPYTFYPNLVDMAREVDCLIAITPGGAATKHMINAEVLEALGPDGVLINVGRGSVVDEPAMIAALEAGKISAVGLDVFDDEPRIPEALRNHPRATLLPHVASGTYETRAAMAALAVENLTKHRAEGKVVTPVPECQHLAQV